MLSGTPAALSSAKVSSRVSAVQGDEHAFGGAFSRSLVTVARHGHDTAALLPPKCLILPAYPRNAESPPPVEWESEAILRPRWRRAS